MATYEYRCSNGHIEEESRSIHEGPKPDTCPECGAHQKNVYFTSLLIWGDFFVGDDDFSRRYHLNGEAGKWGGKGNRTQGQTNINAHLRKYGKAGLPLEFNPGVKDRTKSWDVDMGTPPGLEPTTEAPIELQSSSARGTHLKDEPA